MYILCSGERRKRSKTPPDQFQSYDIFTKKKKKKKTAAMKMIQSVSKSQGHQASIISINT